MVAVGWPCERSFCSVFCSLYWRCPRLFDHPPASRGRWQPSKRSRSSIPPKPNTTRTTSIFDVARRTRHQSRQRRKGRIQVCCAVNPERLFAQREPRRLRHQRHPHLVLGPKHEHPPAQRQGTGDRQRPATRRDAAPVPQFSRSFDVGFDNRSALPRLFSASSRHS
jgi:hypothetical protein